MDSGDLEEDVLAAYDALPDGPGDNNDKPESNDSVAQNADDIAPVDQDDATREDIRPGSVISMQPPVAADAGGAGDGSVTRSGSRLGSTISLRPSLANEPGMTRSPSQASGVISTPESTVAGSDAADRAPTRAGSRLGSSSGPQPDPAAREPSRPGTAASVAPPRPPSTRPPASRPGSEAPAARAARVSATRVRAPHTVSEGVLSPKPKRPDNLEEPLVEVAEEEFEFQGDNIWEIAEKMNQARILRGIDLTEVQSVETTLLFVGTRQSGKSSMIHKFLDREEAPKTTLGLEYSYGRKAGKGLVKDVCHIWELGGGTTYTPLLDTPLRAERLPHLAIFVVVDLTRPESMWNTLEAMLKTLRDGIEAGIGSAQGREMQLKERLRAATEQRVPSDHQDAAHMKAFPVPLVIIGGRYDIFQDWEPEKKKLVCRSLRYLAHVNGATLQFFSSKDSALVKKAKDLMASFGFGGETSGGHLAQDHHRPLLIPVGADSLPVILGVGADTSYSAVRNAFVAQYPQDDQGSGALPEDPAKDVGFREPEIDQLRSQKDQELDRMRRELERRRKWGEEL